METAILQVITTVNQLLTAGIAITAFSLFLYSLSFNLRVKVARTFAFIMVTVVIIFVGESLASIASSAIWVERWSMMQWIGHVFMPATYLHFSDALLATTGRPSRGRRTWLVRIAYLFSLLFLALLLTGNLVGTIDIDAEPVPHLQPLPMTWIFAVLYGIQIIWAWTNLVRAHGRTVTKASSRRMNYLIIGSLAPAMGSYPFLLFGSAYAENHPMLFWMGATTSNILTSVFLVVMAYAVAFFGVSWPDRVVKRRLFKWILRGPVTGSTVLAVNTIVRRLGERMGSTYTAAVPVSVVLTVLIMHYFITMTAPFWERRLFLGGKSPRLQLLQSLEDKLITHEDLQQFLEALLTAICDRLQSPTAFITILSPIGLTSIVATGNVEILDQEDFSKQAIDLISSKSGEDNDLPPQVFSWGDYWLFPLYESVENVNELLGFMTVHQSTEDTIQPMDDTTVNLLIEKAVVALVDRKKQLQLYSTLEELSTEVDRFQRLRAASSYADGGILTEINGEISLEDGDMSKWVKDALNHYWGGPKLTENPLLQLKTVQRLAGIGGESTTNALRKVLKRAIDRVRPEGERRFTTEWILYNILELKFLEGKKVREVALRLAVSEADLYRKQRVAIEEVVKVIKSLESETNVSEITDTPDDNIDNSLPV